MISGYMFYMYPEQQQKSSNSFIHLSEESEQGRRHFATLVYIRVLPVRRLKGSGETATIMIFINLYIYTTC